MKKKVSKISEYFKSEDWNKIKLGVIQLRGCKCEQCLEETPIENIYLKLLNFKNLYNEQPEDLRLVCKKCLIPEILERKQKGVSGFDYSHLPKYIPPTEEFLRLQELDPNRPF